MIERTHNLQGLSIKKWAAKMRNLLLDILVFDRAEAHQLQFLHQAAAKKTGFAQCAVFFLSHGEMGALSAHDTYIPKYIVVVVNDFCYATLFFLIRAISLFPTRYCNILCTQAKTFSVYFAMRCSLFGKMRALYF